MWVLIVYAGHALTMHDFSSKEACEKAKVQIEVRISSKAICVEK